MLLRNRQPNPGTKSTCSTWVAQKKLKKSVVLRTRGSDKHRLQRPFGRTADVAVNGQQQEVCHVSNQP